MNGTCAVRFGSPIGISVVGKFLYLVSFNAYMTRLKEALNSVCDCEYPANIEEIENRCEDVEVELRGGSKADLGDILGTIEDPPEEFQSSNELYNYIVSLAPEESIGRKYYDDRGSNNIQGQREEKSI